MDCVIYFYYDYNINVEDHIYLYIQNIYTMLMINNLFTVSRSARATRSACVGVYKSFFFTFTMPASPFCLKHSFLVWSSTVNFTQNVLSARLHVRKINKNDCINTLMLIYVTIKAASKFFAENMSTINGLVDYQ